MVCWREIPATALVCPMCEQRPDGKPRSAGADAFEKLRACLAPVVMKHQDRGGRSPEGTMRDDFRKRWRRAKALGWSSVLDRWDNDDKDDYLFRHNLMGEGWSREDIKRVDEVACSEGKPVPKRGDGT